jgi:hypothetical protein
MQLITILGRHPSKENQKIEKKNIGAARDELHHREAVVRTGCGGAAGDVSIRHTPRINQHRE